MTRVFMLHLFLLMTWMVNGQDFASRFKGKFENDSNLICVTISPKMMQDIVENTSQKDNNIMGVIANLKSMQMCVCQNDGATYYDTALTLFEEDKHSFEPYISYDEVDGDCTIMIRKKKSDITELVMLLKKNEGFALINFTGNMNTDFIAKLSETLKKERAF